MISFEDVRGELFEKWEDAPELFQFFEDEEYLLVLVSCSKLLLPLAAEILEFKELVALELEEQLVLERCDCLEVGCKDVPATPAYFFQRQLRYFLLKLLTVTFQGLNLFLQIGLFLPELLQ